MANEQPEKMNGTSLDIAAEQRARLKELFPTVFTEIVNDAGETVESVDFGKLQAELGTFTDLFEARRERYGMEWPGKKDALRLIQTLSHATLKPCREESVNFDETEHLFIEGDNLEVLKLLQKSYYGKVKMIYIDPPYNTGHEFIYPDNYTEDLQTYLEYAGLVDSSGKKFSTNTANEGRFHTKWLNMMYPRLYLARNLLRDEGVIFISIDDNEVTNLKKLCDEVFGEENFIGIISRMMKSGGAKGRFFTPNIDFICVYSKNKERTDAFRSEILQEQIDRYYTKIETGGPRAGEIYGEERLYKASLDHRPNQRYWIECPDGSFVIPPGVNFPEIVAQGVQVAPTSEDGVWKWVFSSYVKELTGGNIVFKQTTTSALLNQNNEQSKWNIYNKVWLKDQQEKGMVPSNFVEKFENRQSSAELKDLDIIFDFAKPSRLIKYLLEIARTSSDDIILDFFAGSATTAHAVLEMNKQDGGHRKFIMVQLPEPCEEDSEAFKAGYHTIADIGKERIRRVIKKLNAAQEGKLDLEGDKDQDRGFRVLKLDQSNFKQWRPIDASVTVEQLALQLTEHVDHVSHAASQEALLFEILLKAGFQPTEKADLKEYAGVQVFSIADGALLICLAEKVTKEVIDQIAEDEPMQFICLDSAFGGNDQLKSNAVQTFAARNLQKEKHNQIVFKTV